MASGTTHPSAERILITGASGNVGLETVRALMKRPDQSQFVVIAGSRNPAGSKQDVSVQPDEFVPLDFTNVDTFDAALSGISRVLLVRPPQLASVDAYFKPFMDAMKRAGVRQVVFLSLQGVENNRLTPHYKIEQLIVESGVPFTFLRPGFFMQNLSTTHRNEIRLRNEIFVPAGNGRTSFVDVRDIGAVAALTLTSMTAEHLHKGYELTGSEALTYGDAARMLTAVLGRTITYRDPSVIRFIWQKWRKERTPMNFTLIMVALYTVSKMGKAAGITKEIDRLLGRPPITFQQFANDYRAIWMP